MTVSKTDEIVVKDRAASRPRTARKRARSETAISLRVSVRDLDLIGSAAAVLGKTRTDFMLESACRTAIDVLLDQRMVRLDATQYEAFLDLLDQPPPPNDTLKRLLATKAPWEA